MMMLLARCKSTVAVLLTVRSNASVLLLCVNIQRAHVCLFTGASLDMGDFQVDERTLRTTGRNELDGVVDMLATMDSLFTEDMALGAFGLHVVCMCSCSIQLTVRDC